MKLSHFFILFFIINIAKAQKTITIRSADDLKPLANVLIYHKTNLIGETNKEGKATLLLNNVDSLIFVKNEYEDIILAKAQLTETINMLKNKVILLKEIIVSPMTAQQLLKKVGDFIKHYNQDGSKRSTPSYDIPHNLQIYNKFMAGNDTLHYLNNRFNFDKGNFKINNQTQIIKKFERVQIKDNILYMYSWDGKKTNFPDLSSLTPLGIHYSVEFSSFFDHQKLFDYKIIASESYYRLEFRQKKRHPWFSIEGYMIVDKADFGIYEFETRLLDNKSRFEKVTNFNNLKPVVFKIDYDTYKFKYTKENDGYVLVYCSKNSRFTEEKGQYKNSLFSSTVQVERTIDFGDKNLKSFDVYKWEIK